jgi:hypothetical protein
MEPPLGRVAEESATAKARVFPLPFHDSVEPFPSILMVEKMRGVAVDPT